jgi:hypothetical protein
MRIKKGFVLREVCAQKVVVAEGEDVMNFGELLTINESASFIWQEALKQGDFTIESLIDAFLNEYDVDRETALRDISEIISKLKDKGIIE